MRIIKNVLRIIGPCSIIAAQIVFTFLLATPSGIRIHSPEKGATVDRAFDVAGDAWMRDANSRGASNRDASNRDASNRDGIALISVIARQAGGENALRTEFEAARDMVRYRGENLFALSTWKARIELPADGEWYIKAIAYGTDGLIVETSERRCEVREGGASYAFRSWTPEHFIPLGLILAVSVVLGLAARQGKRFDVVAVAIVSVLFANELNYQFYWFFAEGWAVPTALMLQMCGLSILLMPSMLFSGNPRTRQYLFDILYFWGIGGAIQALIAPDIGQNGFPALRYFSFFISHGLIIAGTLVMAIAGKVRITFRSCARALIVTTLLLVPMYLIDLLLRFIPPYDAGNYFVLGYPPPTGSIVDIFSDVFGPSPRYVVGLELMGIAIFLVLYAPWGIASLVGRWQKGKPRG